MVDRAGRQLGNYRLLSLLGQGGFAEVYLGEHVFLKKAVAIKVLYTQLGKDDLEGFLREAQTIAHLEHPHIVRVTDFGLDGDLPYLVMEYAPNGTLRQRHPRDTTLPFATISAYVKQIAAALQYAHDEKLVHRDIKPENMLLNRNNELLLSDFGLATVAHRTATQNTQSIAGTAVYMAPELFRGKSYPASDQYALGIVVYEWLSGQPPFNEGDFIQLGFQHSYEQPEMLSVKIPAISPAVNQVVMKALEKKPTNRYPTIQAFALALEDALVSHIPATVPVRPVAPMPSSSGNFPGSGLVQPAMPDQLRAVPSHPLAFVSPSQPSPERKQTGLAQPPPSRNSKQPTGELPRQKQLLQAQTLIDRLAHSEPIMVRVPGVPENLPRSMLKKYGQLRGRKFEIGEYAVTNTEYQRFVAEGHRGHRVPKYWKQGTFSPEKVAHPVVGITKQDAEAYCAWRSRQTGKQYRLPTPQEWEWAATGPQGLRYPWGKRFDQGRCNTKESGIGETTPVDRYVDGKSFCGAKDMSGNVWEMTAWEIPVKKRRYVSEVQQEELAFMIAAWLAIITAAIVAILICIWIINLPTIDGPKKDIGSILVGLLFGGMVAVPVYFVALIVFMIIMNVILAIIFFILNFNAESESKPKSKFLLRGGAWNSGSNEATCFSRKHWIDKRSTGFRLMREV